MADMSWLRGFQRSRPQQQSPTRLRTSAGETSPPAKFDDTLLPSSVPVTKPKARSSTPDSASTQHRQSISPVRPGPAQRVSSLLGIGAFGFGLRSATPSQLDELDPTFRYGARHWSGGGENDYVPEARELWHNPSLMQMVETLQVEMMSKRNPLTPIPVVYNSYVLNLIEGFAKLSREVQTVREELAELKSLREKELDQFRGISEEWIQRERDYKAEVKRLELILARESKDGIASVALARHDSLVDRSEMRRFEARLKRMSNSQDQEPWAEEIPDETQTANDSAEAATYHRPIGATPHPSVLNHDVLMSHTVIKRERDMHRLEKEQQRMFDAQHRAHGIAAQQTHRQTKCSQPKRKQQPRSTNTRNTRTNSFSDKALPSQASSEQLNADPQSQPAAILPVAIVTLAPQASTANTALIRHIGAGAIPNVPVNVNGESGIGIVNTHNSTLSTEDIDTKKPTPAATDKQAKESETSHSPKLSDSHLASSVTFRVEDTQKNASPRLADSIPSRVRSRGYSFIKGDDRTFFVTSAAPTPSEWPLMPDSCRFDSQLLHKWPRGNQSQECQILTASRANVSTHDDGRANLHPKMVEMLRGTVPGMAYTGISGANLDHGAASTALYPAVAWDDRNVERLSNDDTDIPNGCPPLRLGQKSLDGTASSKVHRCGDLSGLDDCLRDPSRSLDSTLQITSEIPSALHSEKAIDSVDSAHWQASLSSPNSIHAPINTNTIEGLLEIVPTSVASAPVYPPKDFGSCEPAACSVYSSDPQCGRRNERCRVDCGRSSCIKGGSEGYGLSGG